MFYTDMSLYESILFHLLANAVKFSPPDSVITIEVKLIAVELNDDEPEDYE